ncbi:EAL domain-containing protein [Salinarimonas chemoclinalis]|uniref:EAL domain-containing protein n=1 Tax=Salinarimonas chemoclinalis TaxID=3241599 RepID=UPI003555C2F9
MEFEGARPGGARRETGRSEAGAKPAACRPERARGPLDPRSVLTSIGEVVYDWDVGSDALAWSANAPEVFGLPDLAPFATGAAFGLACEDIGGRTRHDAVLDAGRVESAQAASGAGVPYRATYLLRLPAAARGTHGAAADGCVQVEDTGRWYADSEGRPVFAHGVLRLAPVAREAQSGPDTRAAFLAQIGRDVTAAARANRPMTLLVMSIEGLERLNEEHGFEVADLAIEEAMRRAAVVMRRRDVFARYASNRFGVALLSCTLDQAPIAAERLRAGVEGAPLQTPRGPVSVRVAIGAASAPDHASEAAGLLRRAEEALTASRRTAAGWQIYRPGTLRGGPAPRAGRELDVIAALNERRVVAARQPVVEAGGTRRVAFHEALARIREEDGRIVGAADIIPLVERAGLVPLLDARVLELAARRLLAHPEERLSINLSPLTLETPDWLGILAATLGAHPGVAERLIVEVTETVAVRDPDATRGRLDAMKALGVAIALDDFGAGHTSFRHLRDFPVDLVKIDGAFVQNLARSPDDRFFVRTLIDLAHHLGIPTVAEWVETEEAAVMLAGWGVDYLQGDLFGAARVDAQAADVAPRAAVA